MKWINLADRYPSGKPEFIIRRVGSMDYQIIETIVQSSLGNFAFREHSHYYEIPKDKEAEYEWLDESAEEEPYHVPYYRRISKAVEWKLAEQKANGKQFISSEDVDRIISEAIDNTPARKMYTQEELDRLLAEQHRNTRHDAIEAITEVYVELGDKPDLCFLQMQRDIMNLQQRKP